MGFRNWIGAFGKANALDVNSDLDRGYEAALLIQSLELEYYGDRPIRPDLELSVPKSVQATVLRKFRVAINVCRASLDQLEYQRSQLDPQELRQLQLIESVVNRYSPKRGSAAPTMTRDPDPLPRSLLGVFDKVRRQLNPAGEATLVAGFRRRRDSTLISLKVLLLLILVPLLVQQVSRTYIISPAVDRFAPDLPFLSYPKPQLEEQAVEKLRVYKAEIEFDALLRGDEAQERLLARARLRYPPVLDAPPSLLGDSAQPRVRVHRDGRAHVLHQKHVGHGVGVEHAILQIDAVLFAPRFGHRVLPVAVRHGFDFAGESAGGFVDLHDGREDVVLPRLQAEQLRRRTRGVLP